MRVTRSTPLIAFLWSVPIAALGGLIGLGGAEFRLPVLIRVLHQTARAAVPLNLTVSLATIVFSLVSRSPTIPSALAVGGDLLALAGGAVAAAFLGAGWASRLAETQLRQIIVVLLTAIGLALIGEAFTTGPAAGLLPEDQLVRSVAGVGFGLVIGFFSSVLGVAGGEVIIPTLVFAYGLDIKVAGTASLLISLPTVLTGIVRYARRGSYDDRAVRSIVTPMGAGSVVGAFAGGLALGFVPANLLKLGLGAILIWSARQIFRGSH